MKKFHITIKDNETGEILHNVDADAIIGAVHEKGKTVGIGLTKCNGRALLETIACAKRAINEITSKTPVLALLELLDVFKENN